MRVFRSGADGDRLARHLRLFEIDRLVRDGLYPNATRLARDCGVTRKTIQRDLDTLRWEMGAPIVYDAKRRGYCYAEPGYSLPAVTVTEQELFALVVAERAIDNYVGTPLEDPLRRAFAKLGGCLSADAATRLEFTPASIHFVGTPGPTITAEVWKALHLAIRERRTMAMRVYVAYRNQEVERRFDPYAMLVRERDWYVIGYDHRSGQFPYFYVPRIRALQLTDETFEVHSDFDLKLILAKGFAGMAGDGRPRDPFRQGRRRAGPGAALVRPADPQERSTRAGDHNLPDRRPVPGCPPGLALGRQCRGARTQRAAAVGA